jgi:hypothetical protein
MKEGLPGGTLRVSTEERARRPVSMLHAGLDLSRKRLDVCLIDEGGEIAGRLAAPPDVDGLRGLVKRIAPRGEPVRGVIESIPAHGLCMTPWSSWAGRC